MLMWKSSEERENAVVVAQPDVILRKSDQRDVRGRIRDVFHGVEITNRGEAAEEDEEVAEVEAVDR